MALQALFPFSTAITMFTTGEPESELTCNASGIRKRARGGVPRENPQLGLLQQQHQLCKDTFTGEHITGNANVAGAEMPSCLHESTWTSTSGRPPAGAPLPAAAASPASLPLSQELVLQLHHKTVDVDALICLQNERIRSRLEEMQKGHCHALLLAMGQGILRRLREKEAELEFVSRRNAELVEKVRQMASENEVWFNVARSNEAIASTLRASLEQVVFLQHVKAAGAITPMGLEEGYGDSGGVSPALPVEDAQPCFEEGAPATEVETMSTGPAAAREGLWKPRRGKGACRVCWEGKASVVMLPCRHLCLCAQCEPRIAACPVCKASNNATLHVFLS